MAKEQNLSDIEELISELLLAVQEAQNQANPKWECQYNVTLTHHKVPRESFGNIELPASAKVNVDVAYLRLHKSIRPKGGTDEEWEQHLIDHHAHTFKSMEERINPNAPWKAQLYANMLLKVVAAGLEYADLLRRLKNTKEMGAIPGREEEKKSDIIITNEMPKPLTEDELKYKDWVQKNHDNSTR